MYDYLIAIKVNILYIMIDEKISPDLRKIFQGEKKND